MEKFVVMQEKMNKINQKLFNF